MAMSETRINVVQHICANCCRPIQTTEQSIEVRFMVWSGSKGKVVERQHYHIGHVPKEVSWSAKTVENGSCDWPNTRR